MWEGRGEKERELDMHCEEYIVLVTRWLANDLTELIDFSKIPNVQNPSNLTKKNWILIQ